MTGRGQFLPQDSDIRAALAELDAADPGPPIIFRIVCHGSKPIARAYDLGVGRAFIVSKTDVPRATEIGGGRPPRVSGRRWASVEAAFLEDQPEDLAGFNLDLYREVMGPAAVPPPKSQPRVPSRCPHPHPEGHIVIVGRWELRQLVEEYRAGRMRPGRYVRLTIEHTREGEMLGVLSS